MTLWDTEQPQERVIKPLFRKSHNGAWFGGHLKNVVHEKVKENTLQLYRGTAYRVWSMAQSWLGLAGINKTVFEARRLWVWKLTVKSPVSPCVRSVSSTLWGEDFFSIIVSLLPLALLLSWASFNLRTHSRLLIIPQRSLLVAIVVVKIVGWGLVHIVFSRFDPLLSFQQHTVQFCFEAGPLLLCLMLHCRTPG